MKTLLFLVLILGILPLKPMAQSSRIPGEFVHSVYFWLKNPESEKDRNEFLEALETFIGSSEYVTSYHIAPSAGTPRDVVDNSYTFNLVATFPSAEVQDKYQTEPAHVKFVEDASHLWDSVKVYDSYPARPSLSNFNRGDIHIGVVVSDLEKSVNFYTNILGMVRDGGFEVDGEMAGRLGLTDNLTLNVVTLKTNKSPAASQWKLMSFENSPSNTQGNYINERLGMRYITLFVNDLSPVLDRINAAGITLLGETPQP